MRKKLTNIHAMNRFLVIITALLCLSGPLPAKNKKELVIFHTNDTHSCIYPLNPNLADTMLADRGGYIRRLNMINAERKKHKNMLLIDSGDFSQGSPYYTLFMGDVETELMNMMGYDIGTIGNHEFDYGLDNMARIFRKCHFPIVCSNYDFTGTAVEGTVKRYAVMKKNGVKIGFFGLSPELDGLVSKDNYQGVEFLDPVNTAREMVEILRGKEHCDIVICISHLGWTDDPSYMGDNNLIRLSTGIDLVLGGHSHTYMEQLEYITDADGHQVAVDQNGKYGIYVGKITLELTKK